MASNASPHHFAQPTFPGQRPSMTNSPWTSASAGSSSGGPYARPPNDSQTGQLFNGYGFASYADTDPLYFSNLTYPQGQGYQPSENNRPERGYQPASRRELNPLMAGSPTNFPAPMDKFLEQSEPVFLDRQVAGVKYFSTQGKSSRWQMPENERFIGHRGPASNAPSTAYAADSGYATGPGHAPSIQGSTGHRRTFSHAGSDRMSLADGINAVKFQEETEARTYAPPPAMETAKTPTPVAPPAVSAAPAVPLASGAPKRCTHPDCPKQELMSPSIYNKHMQRHVKPFRCSQEGCARPDGFTSRNDLERHLKTVHKVVITRTTDRSFMCQGSAACKRKQKVWPRLDNFKQHCRRLHAHEDEEALIQRSEQAAAAHTGVSGLTVNSGVGSGRRAQRAGAPPRQPRPLPEQGKTDGERALLDPRQGRTEIQAPILNPFDTPMQMEEDMADARDGGLARLRHPDASMDLLRGLPGFGPGQEQGIFYDEQREEPVGGPIPRDALEAWHLSEQASGRLLAGTSRAHPDTGPLDILGRLKQRLAVEFTTSHAQGTFTPKLALEAVEAHLSVLFDKLAPATGSVHEPAPNAHKRSADEAGMEAGGEDYGPGADGGQADGSAAGAGEGEEGGGGGGGGGGSSSRNGGSKRQQVQCRSCLKQMSRLCDLKKHEKRHSRPWGCTSEGCNKRFGSKNDWKRHEGSQHYQLETWRCAQPCAASRISCCARSFFRVDPFRAHLRRDHGMVDEERLREESQDCRIGRNWQERFWCGFCRTLVKLSKKGLQAWDERFNHIDDAHFKRGEKIDDWYPLDKDLPKGKLRSAPRRGLADDSDAAGGATGPATPAAPAGTDDLSDSGSDSDDQPAGDGSDPPPPAPPPAPSAHAPRPVLPPPKHPDDESPDGSEAGTACDDDGGGAGADEDAVRAALAAGSPVPLGAFGQYCWSTRRRFAYSWFCCKCSTGPLTPTSEADAQCSSCSHAPCDECSAQTSRRQAAS